MSQLKTTYLYIRFIENIHVKIIVVKNDNDYYIYGYILS